ncbi:hypothetical protein BDP81DRAFT_498558 [Colletotrichum phormii]|uniref:Vegetative incompatibility protein HET-E-1 n=1 Tax=Colletotrichum phormii TaxID=359342 RepID=A0AAJ0A285_9PEZI|nr:uncharacterized protein BDP81DRAFT_498558 [Colletotrichum phormii]KAK1655086.1 hypothetical protein BDP81DRAFT_498558 [Colletotrichum phormii]
MADKLNPHVVSSEPLEIGDAKWMTLVKSVSLRRVFWMELQSSTDLTGRLGLSTETSMNFFFSDSFAQLWAKSASSFPRGWSTKMKRSSSVRSANSLKRQDKSAPSSRILEIVPGFTVQGASLWQPMKCAVRLCSWWLHVTAPHENLVLFSSLASAVCLKDIEPPSLTGVLPPPSFLCFNWEFNFVTSPELSFNVFKYLVFGICHRSLSHTIISDPRKYTVGWICAIATEFAVAQLFLDEIHEDPLSVSKHDNNALGRIGSHNVVIAVLPEGEYGTTSAAEVGRDMLHTFENVRVGLMVGIGGGAPSSKNDIRLGDVVGKFGRPGVHLDNLYRSKIVHDDGQPHPNLHPDSFVQRQSRANPRRPAIHYGLVTSANQLIKNAFIRDKLVKDHDILCFEMEAAGLMNHFPCIVVKGICDYCDTHKNDVWQGYAALVAAAYAKALICRISRAKLEEQERISDELSKYFETHIGHNTLAKLKVSQGACFDTYDDQNEPECLENTRVDLLHRINTWAGDFDDQRMFWLSGLAGTGKSTISRTIAKRLDSLKLLGASFFFKRGESDRSNGSGFFGTIARQLVTHRSELKPYVLQAIKDQDDISHKNLREQFDKLFLGPLENAYKGSGSVLSSIIIVDALDECDNKGDVKLLIPMLHELAEISFCRIKVFITSRPDTAVHFACRPILGSYREFILHEVSKDTIDHDIGVFLDYELSNIREDWNAEHDATLDADWPGAERLQTLIQKATPLFIFAATACRFIQDSLLGSPETQLMRTIEHQSANGGTTINDKLEETYLPVLEGLLIKRRKSEQAVILARFSEIVGTIILLKRLLSTQALGAMLAVEPDAITSFLAALRSIIDTRREKHQPLKLFHTSFRDFLLSAGAGVFRINRVACHRRLGLASLELLHTREPLRENCCDLSPGTELGEIPTQLINDRLPSQVQYACLHWVGHLTQAQYALRADDHVHQFLKVHFLHWIEALAILGSATKSIEFANALLSLKMADDPGLLRDLIQDIKSFLTSQILSFEAFPRQVYFSALLFAPSGSVVRKIFKKWIPKFISMQPAVGSNWTSQLHSFRIADKTSTYLYSLCFSPNEKLLALGLSDGTIVIRTVLTGTLLQVIRAHKDAVIALAFFSDSRRVASSSTYSLMIHLAESGELVQETASTRQKIVSLDISRCSATVAIASWGLAVEYGLISLEGKAFRLLGTIDGKDSLRPSITVSQDSKLVAGSAGRYIKIWSIHGGTCLQALEDSQNVLLVLFLPSGILLSRTCDGTVRFWCCSQGVYTQTVKMDSLPYIHSAFSPASGLVALCQKHHRIEIRSFESNHTVREVFYKRYPHDTRANELTLALSPDGNFLAVADIQIATCTLWSVEQLEQPATNMWEKASTTSTDSAVACRIFPENPGFIISLHSEVGGAGEHLRLWLAANSRCPAHYIGTTWSFSSIVGASLARLSSNGRTLVQQHKSELLYWGCDGHGHWSLGANFTPNHTAMSFTISHDSTYLLLSTRYNSEVYFFSAYGLSRGQIFENCCSPHSLMKSDYVVSCDTDIFGLIRVSTPSGDESDAICPHGRGEGSIKGF